MERPRWIILVGHLGELEQLILFAVTALGDDAYGGAIRAHLEERSGRGSCARHMPWARRSKVSWAHFAAARAALT